ncbi:MAG: META domain-containing protein [Acidimicrobiia bacterium]|nr:META domain-containing protein [Acidimicrobiia bacterium]
MRITRALAATAVSAVLAAGLLVACGGDDSGSADGGGATSVAPIDLDGRTFLSHTVTIGGRDRPLVDGTRITLTFDGGTVGASAGCNSMSGSYDLDGDVLRLGDLATTEMGCDPERHDQDQWLAGFLADSPEVRLSEPELTLTAGDSVVALVDREVAEPDAELVGTHWTLESIIDGDAASSVPAGVDATFEISDDGTVAVVFGCNSGGGSAEITDATLVFGQMAMTKMRCEEPAMQVEGSVVAVLTGEVAYEIDADRLSMRNGESGLDWRATE